MVSRPLGLMRRIIPPSSSMWASTMMRGPWEPCLAIMEPRPSNWIESAWGLMNSSMIRRIGSSKPEGPGASDSFCRSSTVRSWAAAGSAKPRTSNQKPANSIRMSLVANHRRRDPLHHAIHRAATLMPVPHEHDVVLGIDPNDVPSVADGSEARRRTAGPLLLFRVQPPQVAVVRTMLAGSDGFIQPFRGNDLLAAPLSMVEDQQAEARQVLRVDPQPAAPARATADGFDLAPIDLDRRFVAVAVPAPLFGRADRIHDVLLEDLRQSFAEQA